ncbi:MAG TPA: rhomboid family intramembrane serine protease [Aldersonia sp.]
MAALIIGCFVALLYVIEFVDGLLNHRLDAYGIQPLTLDGLSGILFAPLLHGGWDHLAANTIPLLVLGFLTLMTGITRGLAATAIIWVIGGLGTWLTGGPNTIHLGASVLVFGWLAYLLVRGIFTRSFGQIALGAVVLLVYGSLLWGVLPGEAGVSWQGHLFGAIGGVVAAWVLSSQERGARRAKAAHRSILG